MDTLTCHFCTLSLFFRTKCRKKERKRGGSYLFMKSSKHNWILCILQCWGSVSFWYGSEPLIRFVKLRIRIILRIRPKIEKIPFYCLPTYLYFFIYLIFYQNLLLFIGLLFRCTKNKCNLFEKIWFFFWFSCFCLCCQYGYQLWKHSQFWSIGA